MLENLNGYHIVLASNSPRRKELLKGLDIDFEVRIIHGIDESYPETLHASEIPLYIAEVKANKYLPQISEKELLITADTVVVLGEKVFGKPVDYTDACNMLSSLSGKTHKVITGVCLITKKMQRKFSVSTDVTFSSLTRDEIEYYVKTYSPMDKAGAYGIQEWIGHVAVSSLEGSYFNVMGLPVQRIYKELKTF
ncbi:Maf-like protein [Xylanibacter oryzae]|uniref:Maf-like protein n=1 Tax=Xylanibacter oryzae TaxID=185293 RepID=UPI0004B3026D|nr:Maf-like protein [Xylanibacter oryzae]